MILEKFPDLKYLKERTEDKNHKWPSVIISTEVKETYRNDIRGPLSIFYNISGSSYCTVENRKVLIEPDFYFITNPQQYYTLAVEPENNKTARTFNIHFGQDLMEEVYSGIVTTTDKVLVNENINSSPVHFFNSLYRKNSRFEALVNKLSSLEKGNNFQLQYEETLSQFLVYLLAEHRDIMKKAASLPPVKASTRFEIYKRLLLAVDYIRTGYYREISLEELAAAACLSKFHFLRLFSMAFSQTPYQFLSKVRLEKSLKLLKNRKIPINEIAFIVGFDNSSSFSRFFRKQTGYYPQAYRDKAG